MDKNTIKQFMCLEEQHKMTEQLRILAKHREKLLNIYHEYQRKLDCLDFLIFNNRQKKKTILNKTLND